MNAHFNLPDAGAPLVDQRVLASALADIGARHAGAMLILVERDIRRRIDVMFEAGRRRDNRALRANARALIGLFDHFGFTLSARLARLVESAPDSAGGILPGLGNASERALARARVGLPRDAPGGSVRRG